MSIMIDLHTHSYFSDGTLSPARLIEMAESGSFRAIALTDHDTTAGISEALKASKGKNVKFIPGIELSVDHKPGELHILGLGLLNWEEAPLLQQINKNRTLRNKKIITLMNDQGLDICYDDLRKLTKGTIGRPHFAYWMVTNRHARNINDAFNRFLCRGGPFHFPRETVSLESAIDFIHSCGGLAIVAHPLKLPINFSMLMEKLETWMLKGIDGIEAVHSGAKKSLSDRLIKYGREKGLLLTGGSDFHGKNKPGIRLGRTSKTEIIPDKYLPEALMQREY